MSLFTNWFLWSNKINQNRSFDPPTEDLERKIVAIQGEIIPGWITIDVGYFDSNGTYYTEKTRSISIPIPSELSSIVDNLLSATISDEELQLLLNHAYTSPQMLSQWDGKV